MESSIYGVYPLMLISFSPVKRRRTQFCVLSKRERTRIRTIVRIVCEEIKEVESKSRQSVRLLNLQRGFDRSYRSIQKERKFTSRTKNN